MRLSRLGFMGSLAGWASALPQAPKLSSTSSTLALSFEVESPLTVTTSETERSSIASTAPYSASTPVTLIPTRSSPLISQSTESSSVSSISTSTSAIPSPSTSAISNTALSLPTTAAPQPSSTSPIILITISTLPKAGVPPEPSSSVSAVAPPIPNTAAPLFSPSSISTSISATISTLPKAGYPPSFSSSTSVVAPPVPKAAAPSPSPLSISTSLLTTVSSLPKAGYPPPSSSSVVVPPSAPAALSSSLTGSTLPRAGISPLLSTSTSTLVTVSSLPKAGFPPSSSMTVINSSPKSPSSSSPPKWSYGSFDLPIWAPPPRTTTSALVPPPSSSPTSVIVPPRPSSTTSVIVAPPPPPTTPVISPRPPPPTTLATIPPLPYYTSSVVAPPPPIAQASSTTVIVLPLPESSDSVLPPFAQGAPRGPSPRPSQTTITVVVPWMTSMPSPGATPSRFPPSGQPVAKPPGQPKPAQQPLAPPPPKPAQPTLPAQPKPAQPKPAQPSPVQPKPAQPKPAQPGPIQPKPAQPGPIQPKPAQPKPAQPKPAQPAPPPPKAGGPPGSTPGKQPANPPQVPKAPTPGAPKAPAGPAKAPTPPPKGSGPPNPPPNPAALVPQIQIYGMSGFVLYEWPEGTDQNHLSVRPNGQLVVTMYDRPEIHVFDPFTPTAAPLMAHRFTPNTRINAIAEYIPDQYAVLGTLYNAGAPPTTMLWSLRLDSISGPRLNWLTQVPDAESIVSMVAFNMSTLLAADANGAMRAINVNTGANREVLSDPTMLPGISTVKYQAPYIYYTNTASGIFARLPVDAETLEPLAPAEQIVDHATGIVDVALAPYTEQEGYLVNYEQNTVLRVNAQAKVDTVMTGIRAPTAAAFGRTPGELKTLYVVSGAPLGGAGKIVSIRVEP